MPPSLPRMALLLWGLVATPASAASPFDPAPPARAPLASDAHDTAALSRSGVEGTKRSIELISTIVANADPQDVSDAAFSLERLAVSCPFTRSALQLPFALLATVEQVPVDRLAPAVRADWATLQSGLAEHVAVLETLGVTLAPPRPGDPLWGEGPGLGLDRTALRRAADPLAASAQFVDRVAEVARHIDAEALADIEHHSDRVEALTGVRRPCPRDPHSILPGHPWTLGMQLGGWHSALTQLEPSITDPVVHERVVAMIRLLDSHQAAGWVGRYPRQL